MGTVQADAGFASGPGLIGLMLMTPWLFFSHPAHVNAHPYMHTYIHSFFHSYMQTHTHTYTHRDVLCTSFNEQHCPTPQLKFRSLLTDGPQLLVGFHTCNRPRMECGLVWSCTYIPTQLCPLDNKTDASCHVLRLKATRGAFDGKSPMEFRMMAPTCTQGTFREGPALFRNRPGPSAFLKKGQKVLQFQADASTPNL